MRYFLTIDKIIERNGSKVDVVNVLKAENISENQLYYLLRNYGSEWLVYRSLFSLSDHEEPMGVWR